MARFILVFVFVLPILPSCLSYGDGKITAEGLAALVGKLISQTGEEYLTIAANGFASVEGYGGNVQQKWIDIDNDLFLQNMLGVIETRLDTGRRAIEEMQKYFEMHDLVEGPTSRSCCSKEYAKWQPDLDRWLGRVDFHDFCHFIANTTEPGALHPPKDILLAFNKTRTEILDDTWFQLYFTSVQGVTIIHPASFHDWEESQGGCPEFRNEQFFTQITVGRPKSVVILVDISVHMGLRKMKGAKTYILDQAKQLVEKLVDNILSDAGDLVGIIFFEAESFLFLDPDLDFNCSNPTLVHPTSKRKASLKDLLRANISLSARQASFSQPLLNASTLLSEFNHRNFQPVVVLISGSEVLDSQPHLEFAMESFNLVNWTYPPVMITYELANVPEGKISSLETLTKMFPFKKTYWHIPNVDQLDYYYIKFFKALPINLNQTFVVTPVEDAPESDIYRCTLGSTIVKNGELLGVITLKFFLNDLWIFQTNITEPSSDSFQYLINREDMAVILHPILRSTYGGPVFAPIALLEETVRQSYMTEFINGEPVNFIGMSDLSVDKGPFRGYYDNFQELPHRCKPVNNTYVTWYYCVAGKTVTKSEFIVNPKNWEKIKMWHYRTDLSGQVNPDKVEYCQYYDQITYKNIVSTFFPIMCYTDIWHHNAAVFPPTAESVKEELDVLYGRKNNTVFKSFVLEEVAMVSFINDLWTKGRFSLDSMPHIASRMLSTLNAVGMKYPVEKSLVQIEYSSEFDLPWGNEEEFILGAQPTITAKVGRAERLRLQFGTSIDSLWYVGVEVQMNYFEILLKSYFWQDCGDTEKFTCMIMDYSGLLIYHPAWTSANDARQYAPESSPIHIINMEPEIAYHIYKTFGVVTTYLNDFASNFQFVNFLINSLNKMSWNFLNTTNAWYRMENFDGHSAIIVKRNNMPYNTTTNASNECTCQDGISLKSGYWLPAPCDLKKMGCQCVCYVRKIFNQCDTFWRAAADLDSNILAKMDLRRKVGRLFKLRIPSVDNNSLSLKPKKMAALPICSGWSCEGQTLEVTCNLIAGCFWCDRVNRNGNLTKNDQPFCAQVSFCPQGIFTVPILRPKGIQNLAEIIVGVVFGSLALISIPVIGFLCRKYQMAKAIKLLMEARAKHKAEMTAAKAANTVEMSGYKTTVEDSFMLSNKRSKTSRGSRRSNGSKSILVGSTEQEHNSIEQGIGQTTVPKEDTTGNI